MNKLIDLNSPEVSNVIDKLLVDKTTGKNIIFAEDDYLQYDKLAMKEAQITKGFISKYGAEYVTPRVNKHIKLQSDRTRENAEVFTPSWICNQMNNYIDEDWFGHKDVFNKMKGQSWVPKADKIDFKEKNWKAYVESTRLEITCGEAPYLVSRYDTSNGKPIPLEKRIGLLDRKIRVINENAKDEKEWLEWVYVAFKNVYGYEFQGDNLLIARINLYLTFIEYFEAKFNRKPMSDEIKIITDIICWNIFQMDGLKNITPFGNAKPKSIQMTIFDDDENTKKTKIERFSDVKILNWVYKKEVLFKEIRKDGNIMKFDYIIGNPPYQEQNTESGRGAAAIYPAFLSQAYKLSQKSLFITPARFLFNAGRSSKGFSGRLLNDSHFKVVEYNPSSRNIFPGLQTPIKGGIAITYYDWEKKFKPIIQFVPDQTMNGIFNKVYNEDAKYLSEITFPQNNFNVEKLLQDFPKCKSALNNEGKSTQIRSNVYEKLPEIFSDAKDKQHDIKLHLISKNSRDQKWLSSKYLLKHDNLDSYKVVIPHASGSGKFGEKIGEPLIAKPKEAYTQSFIGCGSFNSKTEAENCKKYLLAKFTRTMLGFLKVTHNMAPSTFSYVPLQDFSSNSDINWKKSVKEIDEQLYKKYNLSKSEIKFIEDKVREMK